MLKTACRVWKGSQQQVWRQNTLHSKFYKLLTDHMYSSTAAKLAAILTNRGPGNGPTLFEATDATGGE